MSTNIPTGPTTWGAARTVLETRLDDVEAAIAALPDSGTSGSGVRMVSGTVDLTTSDPRLVEVYATAAATVEGVALAADTAAVFSRTSGGQWRYMVVGSGVTTWTNVPGGVDTTAPTAGTLAASSISDTSFTLTVSGASDTGGLHATPYAFSTDNGTTWTAYQAGTVHIATGLTPSTAYQARHRVRDAAGNVSTGTAITVTTSALPADTTPPTGGTLAVTGTGNAGSTRTLTVTGATDAGSGLHATPYAFSTNGGSTYSAYQASNVFTTAALTAGTYQPRARVRDAASTPNVATLSAADFTLAAAGITDTFETGAGELNGRTIGATTWQATPAKWEVTGGVAQNAVDEDGIIARFNALQDDFDLDVELAWTGTAVNPGIVFRYVDVANFYYLTIQPATTRMRVYRVTSGTHTMIRDVALTLAANTTHLFHMEVRGTFHRVDVNGVANVLPNQAVLNAYSATEVACGLRFGKASASSQKMQVGSFTYTEK